MAACPPHVPCRTWVEMDGMNTKLAMNAKQISRNWVLLKAKVCFVNIVPLQYDCLPDKKTSDCIQR